MDILILKAQTEDLISQHQISFPLIMVVEGSKRVCFSQSILQDQEQHNKGVVTA